MKKQAWILISIVMVIALLASCTPAAPTTSQPASGSAATSAPAAPAVQPTSPPAASASQPTVAPPVEEKPTELRIALPNVPTNLDTVMNTADVAAEVAVGPIFEQLVAMDKTYTPLPELAEKWEISADSTTYTYYLRKGILFHNGEEMKAADVIASMNRWIDAAESVKTMVGGAHFTEVDPYTVQIKMEKGTPYLNLMIGGFGQHASIMPKSVIDKVDADSGLVTEYIGTGPYVFDSWVSDQYIKLVRYDKYQPYGKEGDYSGWAGYKHANIDTVYFDLVTDVNTIAAGMQTGEYDAASGLTHDSFDMFANDENFQVIKAESELPAIIFNKKEGWGSNAKFRQAVAALVNMEEIMMAAYTRPEFYNLYSSYMFKSQVNWYTEKGSEYYNVHDKDKALKLFAEAGFTPNDTFTILVANDTPEFYSMAIVIQAQMRAAGLKCELLTYDWSTFVEVRNNQPDKYHAFITSFSEKVLPNMNLFLSPTWAGWCTDERIVADLASIASSTDMEAAKKTWTDLQEYMLAESVPVIKFGTSVSWAVVNKSVEGMDYFNWPTFVDAKIVD